MKAGIWNLLALGAVLGVGTWVASSLLFRAKLPPDFPHLPDTRAMSPAIRNLLAAADQDARKHPRSAEAMGKLGMAYHANDDLEQAAAAYRIASRLAPGEVQWVYCQALLQEEYGNEDAEFSLLRQTVALKHDYVPALIKLADGYFKQEKLDDAARDYGLAAKDANLQASFGLARVAARRDDSNKVIEYAEPLARAYPSVRPPFQLLETAYEKAGRPDKAALMREALLSGKFTDVPPAADPVADRLTDLSYSSTRLLKAAGLQSRFGYPDRAIQIARRARDTNPADPDIPAFLAHTLIAFYPDRPEAMDRALTELSEYLRLKPDDPVPLFSFANDFCEKPKPAAATERLRVLMIPYAGRPDAHYYLGLVLDAQEKIEEALSQYQAALAHHPNDSRVYNKLGLLMDKAGKPDRAVAYLEKSVQLDPPNTIARFNLGVALMQQGNYSRGFEELAEVLRVHPHDAATHFVMGFGYLFTKGIDDAVAHFREGLGYKADDPEAHYGLGTALSIQGKRQDAVAELREALRLRPNYPDALELLHQLER